MTLARVAMSVGCVLALSACADNLKSISKPQGTTSLETTTIDPVAFDAVYVVNGASATISVINAETDAVAATITIRGAAYPHHIAVSPDRSTLGIAVPGFDLSSGEFGHEHHSSRPGHVLLLDAQTGALKAAKQTDAANNNVVFSPDGETVWTSQATSPGSTLVLDADDLETREAIPVGVAPAKTAITPDGRMAYVANSGSASVSVIDVASRSVKATVRVGAGPVVAQPAANGFVFVENEPDESVSVIDGATLEVVRTVDVGFHPGSVHSGPRGEMWITAPKEGRLHIHDSDGKLVRSVDTGQGANWVAFSPDQKRAYVSNEREDTVSVVDVDTLSVKTKIKVGSGPNGMAWRSK